MSYKSKVLNLWSQSELYNLKVVPEEDKVRMFYNNGSFPVEMPYLTTQGENVFQKMNQNATDIESESSVRQIQVAGLSQDITNEFNRATSAELVIQTALDDEKARVAIQEAFEASERAAEQSARQSADNTLSATLNAEIQSRQAQDTQHTNDINAEASRAAQEEERIEEKLDAYVLSNDAKVDAGDAKHDAYETYANARMDVIEGKAVDDSDTFNGFLALETKARTDEIARVDGRIDFIVSNTDAASLDSLAEIVNRFQTDGVDYSQRLSNIESVLQALVEQLGN